MVTPAVFCLLMNIDLFAVYFYSFSVKQKRPKNPRRSGDDDNRDGDISSTGTAETNIARVGGGRSRRGD